MVSLRGFVLALALALISSVAANKNLTTYMPDCAQSCVEKSISGVCNNAIDSQCLCNNARHIGPNSVPCAMSACPGNTTEQLRSDLRSSYMKYCNDVGETAIGGWGPNSPTSFPGSPWTSTRSSSSASSPTAAATAPPSMQESPPDSSDGGGGSDQLSKGAIAGIAVGVGVACIAITAALLLYAFRLGKRHSREKEEHNQGDPRDPSQQEEGVGDSNTAASELTGDKIQLEGKPLSELQTEHAISGYGPVKELPTNEKPVELSADPIPRRMENETPILPHATLR
ncbi:hypothetical protein F5Y04DRAFT_251798 [Hypomontagnella monticulosa]|nr:hypothetical protein F5Y04DRAFT_251798 [Hypomontagnella monticulosa]